MIEEITLPITSTLPTVNPAIVASLSVELKPLAQPVPGPIGTDVIRFDVTVGNADPNTTVARDSMELCGCWYKPTQAFLAFGSCAYATNFNPIFTNLD
ncbi:hypothetical protein BHYA_0059g00030 [Botrytis hyacinthi]|uniref:Uncharacterized protein n=1 Tax=Botrytis hyacinthi TaxID=278943 RepID=A0A4Z1GTW9_9HELO|nr:hypothetical protein BHYA_0059g00030 [Botrytis hyacinthi]